VWVAVISGPYVFEMEGVAPEIAREALRLAAQKTRSDPGARA